MQLYTTVTLDGLMDNLDGIAIAESWADAAHDNAKEASKAGGK